MRISLSVYSALLIIAAAFAVSAVAAGEEAKPATSISELHPGLASGALLEARVTALPEGVLVRSDGMTITQKDKEYEGKLNVVFIDVREEQIMGARYGIQSIPVQIFYDKHGNEVFRHTGFFAKDQIVTKLQEIGVE